MKKQRLDDYLIEHKFARDKDEAFVTVTEGRVFVEGQKAVSPAQMFLPNAKIEVRPERQYVGRGAYKLVGALDVFDIKVEDMICADIGAATGGFTQVLLTRGAAKVYAIDTAKGKLAFKLRDDPRVVVMEETDVRHLEQLPELADIVTIDVSLITLRDILPHVLRLIKPDGSAAVLFKPQYEARDSAMLRHGIIKDDATRVQLFNDFVAWLPAHKWRVVKWIESPIRGSKGNVEYLLHLKPQAIVIVFL